MCFSALQRAENSSILRRLGQARSASRVSVLFSEPKIPQSSIFNPFVGVLACFSALQRAENSSMIRTSPNSIKYCPFQCSSASRKFLNQAHAPDRRCAAPVSVLFSEPKIPQYEARRLVEALRYGFSALQRAENSSIVRVWRCRTIRGLFQCSSASRKFLNFAASCACGPHAGRFSALQRAENSSIHRGVQRCDVP